MKGLILNDLYRIWNDCKWAIYINLCFFAAAMLIDRLATVFIYAGLLVNLVLFGSLCSFDALCEWNVYSQTLPVSRTQYVASKYILCLSFTAVVFIQFEAATAIHNAIHQPDAADGFFRSDELKIALVTFTCLTITAAYMFFIFVSKKGIFIISLFLVINRSTELLFPNELSAFDRAVAVFEAIGLDEPASAAALFALAAALYAASWAISTLIYNRRDLA